MTTLSEVRTIPLEDFFRNDEKTSFQISPLGGYISYMASHQNRMNIYVQKVGEDDATLVTTETDRNIAGYTWKNR